MMSYAGRISEPPRTTTYADFRGLGRINAEIKFLEPVFGKPLLRMQKAKSLSILDAEAGIALVDRI